MALSWFCLGRVLVIRRSSFVFRLSSFFFRFCTSDLAQLALYCGECRLEPTSAWTFRHVSASVWMCRTYRNGYVASFVLSVSVTDTFLFFSPEKVSRSVGCQPGCTLAAAVAGDVARLLPTDRASDV